MNIIERLKNNEKAFGLMDEELKRVAEKIGCVGNFERYREDWVWRESKCTYFDQKITYRLRPGYVCDHRENTLMKDWSTPVALCDWCCMEVEPVRPKFGWVEYAVESFEGKYTFRRGNVVVRLHGAVFADGFGGIRFQTPPGCCSPSIAYFRMVAPEPSEGHGPWIPVSVWFWEELKNEKNW